MESSNISNAIAAIIYSTSKSQASHQTQSSQREATTKCEINKCMYEKDGDREATFVRLAYATRYIVARDTIKTIIDRLLAIIFMNKTYAKNTIWADCGGDCGVTCSYH